MTNSSQKQALERFHLIRPFIEDGVPLVELAVHHTIALRTLQRWVKQYRSDGMAGLGRKNRRDKGISRRLSTPLVQLVEAMALETPRRSIATIHRRICDIAANRGEPSPSYHAVYNIVKAMNPALLTLAHEGSKVYNQTYDLLYRREAEAPNALWQADHTRLDILLLNDKDQPAKPWLSVILDDYSRTVAGYFLSFEAPCALQTALTLHQAIWRKSESAWPVCGVPQILYTDHGSDFISQHIEQVCADLKIRLIFSTVGKPRGRGRIERFFETVNQLLLCTLPGYSPAGSSGVTPVLRVDALEQAFRAFVLEHYHHTPHSATGKTPLARWGENSFLPRLAESLEQLDLLLLTVAKPRRVHRDGIRFQSLRYIDALLAAYVGEAVTIRYDPRDMAEIRVFHHNRFLCRAVCQELVGICYGPPGVGKTLSARYYARWDLFEGRDPFDHQLLVPPELAECRTLFYTPRVTNSPRQSRDDIEAGELLLKALVCKAECAEFPYRDCCELIIVDEADRLKMLSLEQLRDLYDRHQFGLILIGMPGLEKRLARYPQLYSRVGVAHAYRPLSHEEMQFVLEHHWEKLGCSLSPDDFTDKEAVATAIRVTAGNFRLLHRLFTQIERILKLNELSTITREVVETARECLVIGTE